MRSKEYAEVQMAYIETTEDMPRKKALTNLSPPQDCDVAARYGDAADLLHSRSVSLPETGPPKRCPITAAAPRQLEMNT